MPKFQPKTLRVAGKPVPAKFAAGAGYGTRMLQPGETFRARKPIYETVLLATKKVVVDREPADIPPPAPALLEKAATPQQITAPRHRGRQKAK